MEIMMNVYFQINACKFEKGEPFHYTAAIYFDKFPYNFAASVYGNIPDDIEKALCYYFCSSSEQQPDKTYKDYHYLDTYDTVYDKNEMKRLVEEEKQRLAPIFANHGYEFSDTKHNIRCDVHSEFYDFN